MTTVSTSHWANQSARRYRSAVKASNSPHRLLRPVGGHRHEMAGSAHVNARRVQVQLGQPFRFCAALASAHHRLYHCRVGVSPEGAADCATLPNGIAPIGASPMMPS